MDTIVVSVRELEKIVSAMHRDGMDFAQFMLIDGLNGDPGFVSINAIKLSEPEMVVDYEDLDDLPDKADLFDTICGSSSNLQ